VTKAERREGLDKAPSALGEIRPALVVNGNDRAEDLLGVDREFIDLSVKRERKARGRARRIQALVYVLLVGIITGLVGWINQSYLQKQANWFWTMRPYMLAQVRPYVLTTEGRCRMDLGEPANKPSFPVGLCSALLKVREILEQVPEQIRIAPACLLQRVVDDIRNVLREGELCSIYLTRKSGEAGRCHCHAATDGSLNFAPAERAVRNDTGARRLG
jgi:hypothetical protein